METDISVRQDNSFRYKSFIGMSVTSKVFLIHYMSKELSRFQINWSQKLMYKFGELKKIIRRRIETILVS